MSREILFRGKTLYGDWHYGSLMHRNGFSEIHSEYGFCSVENETVGQYTGLMDKHGTKIFEGDIVKTEHGKLAPISFGECSEGIICFYASMFGEDHPLGPSNSKGENHLLEVVGNVHNNPELLNQ